MSESECSKCKSPEWKAAKMVMLEGMSGAKGTTTGEIQKDVLTSRIGGFSPASDRWFDLERHYTRASIHLETVSALAKAVEAAVAEEGAHLKFPDEPKKPKEPSKSREPSRPWRSIPKEMTFEPPKPLLRVEMWVHRRVGWVVTLLAAVIFFPLNQEIPQAESFWAGLLMVYVEPLVTFWTTPFGFAATLAFAAAFSVFWLSGFFGLAQYNQKKFDEAESEFAKEKAAFEPERLAAVKRYEEYDAQMADWRNEQERHTALHEQWLGLQQQWAWKHREWESEVARVTDQRLALWDELRVCLRCAHVYRGADPSESLDIGSERSASGSPPSTIAESVSVSELADTAVDALENVADKASSAASAAANKFKDMFNREESK